MDCTQSQSLLHGYLDQELDLTSTTAIDHHLASCAACRAAFEQESTLRSGVRRYAQYHAAPAALSQRIRAQADRAAISIRTGEKPRRRWFRGGQGSTLGAAIAATWRQTGQWLKIGTAIAATAGITWTAALQLHAPASYEVMAEQVVTGHARSILTGHIADVASSDRHTVKPWLSAKLDFSPPVADLTAGGFPLIGGRLDYLDNRPVAVLVFRRRQHLIDLFVWPDAKFAHTLPTQVLAKQGYHIFHWRDAGMTFWAISDLDAAELRTFAESYARAQPAASTPQ